MIGTARRRDRRTRAPDVGNGRDEQVHLADPGQGVEEANPSRLCTNARRLGCGRPARAVSIRGRVLEAPRQCAGPHHHGRRSCASPRASGSGSRSRPRLSDCHVVAVAVCTYLYRLAINRGRARDRRRFRERPVTADLERTTDVALLILSRLWCITVVHPP